MILIADFRFDKFREQIADLPTACLSGRQGRQVCDQPGKTKVIKI